MDALADHRAGVPLLADLLVLRCRLCPPAWGMGGKLDGWRTPLPLPSLGWPRLGPGAGRGQAEFVVAAMALRRLELAG